MKTTTCRIAFSVAATLVTAGIPNAVADNYSSLILSHGPLAYWRMNEGGGKRARDIVGGHHATYDKTHNNPTFRRPGGVKDSGDRSTGFTGGKLWSAVPYNPALNPRGAFTVTFLAKLNQRYHDWSTGGYWHTAANTWHRIADPGSRNGWSYEGFFIGNYPPNQRWYFYLGAGMASATQPYGYNAIAGGRPTLGRWDHVACTFAPDGGTNENGFPTGTLRLYVNGALVSSLANRANGPNTVMPFIAGAHSTGDPSRTPYWQHSLDGDLDELAVVGKALSQEEVRQLVQLSNALDERTYYVRKTGSDTNDGLTPATAFASFTHAAGHCRAGDTVYVGAGEYQETSNYRFYGTGYEGFPIRFVADKTGEHTGDAGEVLLTGTINHSVDGNGRPTASGNRPFRAWDSSDLHFLGFTFASSYCPLELYRCDRTIIDDCEFTDHGYSVYLSGGSATITNCDVHDNVYQGIRCYYGGHFTVADTKVTNIARSYGLYFYRNPADVATQDMHATVERVEVRNTGSWSTMFYYCNADINDCIYEDNQSGIYFYGDPSGSTRHDEPWHATLNVDNLTVRRTKGSWAMRGDHGDVTLKNSLFEDNSHGVQMSGNRLDSAWHPTHIVENVTVRGTTNSWSLVSYYADATLKNSLFENNSHGVYMAGYQLDEDWHATHTVEDITVRGTTNNWSLMSYYSNASVVDCTFEDNKYGIYLRGYHLNTDWHPTYHARNLTVKGTKGSWAFHAYRGDTTIRDCIFEDNVDCVAIGDHVSAEDVDRLKCIAENLTITNSTGWALYPYCVDAEVRDITSENNRYCIYFYDKHRNSGSDNRCKVTAERIRNTGSTEYWGLLSYRCDLTLTDAQITDNNGGIYLHEYSDAIGDGAQAYFDRVEISRNKGNWGLLNYRTDVDMRNCLVADNKYGIYLSDMDEGSQLWHVTSANNWGHGIYNIYGHVDVYNCLSTGSLQGYGLINNRGTINNDNNLVVGNYRNYGRCEPGLGSVDGIPLFAAKADYHLMDTSPGVNGGRDPGELCKQDLENYERGQNGGWNVGCYATTAPGWEYDDLPHAYAQNNPISWWRLGEKVGDDTAIDIVGGNHGRYLNGVHRAAVSPVSTDGCAFFSSVDQHIRAPHHEKYMIDNGTILMWYRFKEMPSTWAFFFSKKKPGLSAGNITFRALRSNNGRPYLYHEGATRYWPLYSGDPGTLGEWVFLAYTFGSGGAASYENGALVLRRYQATEGWNTTDDSDGNLEPIYIGGSTWRHRDTPDPYWLFVGWIDEVAIFDRQLSGGEIARIYQAALNPKKDPEDMQIPPIWGVTGNDGRLFRIDDYTNPGSTSTDFGQIKWKDNGTAAPIGSSIDSVAVDNSANGYLLVNKALGGHRAPLVMRVSLYDAESGKELVAVPMATIDINGGVNDIAVDPGSGVLFALGANGRLYSIDPVTGDVITDFGELKNASQGLDVENGKSLVFDQLGGLLVLDAHDNHLYRVDKNTALIRRVPDHKYGGGLEASAWDHLNNRAVASNTSNDTLRHLTLMPGNNPSFGSLGGTGLSNVTGLSFVPNEGRGNTSGGWRMTEWIEIR